ncbi:hypothetical protein SeMB42_g01820 [Synchytrium endobioticum]|uniref:Phosphatidylinositol N-acetylglucosaminyltransferase n=1 Tax=Synchytrium endobioticum TaxID=286115 RepID=A0A507DCG6_9FUNG|nr:hypothetical protein SeLEV6574_g01521 [Synchytrium endobioticum]TPX51786.1 hypothetical protein SeMB42_g01820 [Synchytrium endobioticum]
MTGRQALVFAPLSTRSGPVANGHEGHVIGWLLHQDSITCICAWSSNAVDHGHVQKLREWTGTSNIAIVGTWRRLDATSPMSTDDVPGSSGQEDGAILHLPLGGSTYKVHLPHYTIDHQIPIVYYNQPNSRALQYLSLQPLTLDPDTKLMPRQPDDHVRKRQWESAQQHATLFENPNDIDDCLQGVLAVINSALDVERHLVHLGVNKWTPYQHCIESIYALGSRVAHRLHGIHIALMYPSSILIYLIYTIANLCLIILNFPLTIIPCVKDLFVTGQQLDLRCRQLIYWPWQYILWRGKSQAQKLAPPGQAQYIGFYNSVWLVANDIILGVGVGAFITANADLLASLFLRSLKEYGIDTIKSMVVWLMSWPGGLKLNSKLATFLGELFLWLIGFWGENLKSLETYLPAYIQFSGLCGVLGASFVISFAADLLNAATLHLYLFYLVAAKLHSWQVTVILSLFNLFRGQRNNPLRKRIDAADYDLDQLLLGTILFTVLIFLFPTVAVYYLLFYMSRVVVISLHGLCDIALAIINHFPLFAIMLRFKDPGRLPAGTRFRLSPGLDGLVLENVPIGLSTTFYQYRHLLSLLQKRLFSRDVITSSLDGSYIHMLSALQYPSPPRLHETATLQEIRAFLLRL